MSPIKQIQEASKALTNLKLLKKIKLENLLTALIFCWTASIAFNFNCDAVFCRSLAFSSSANFVTFDTEASCTWVVTLHTITILINYAIFLARSIRRGLS